MPDTPEKPKRVTKTPTERAVENRDRARNAVKRAATIRDRLKAELDDAQKKLDDARTRFDYADQDPALPPRTGGFPIAG